MNAVRRLALLLLGLLAGVPAVSARNAPDPLPSWSTLEASAATNKANLVMSNVSDEIGTIWTLSSPSGAVDVYIWDIALVQHPDNTVTFLRLELQSEAGDYLGFASTLAQHPSGSTALTTLSTPNSAQGQTFVEFTDENGLLQCGRMPSRQGQSPVAS